MADSTSNAIPESRMETLVVRRTIPATPERLFAARTEPQQLLQWWGPKGVVCVDPEMDLRVGGHYRIGNQFPDKKVLWIVGEFEVVDPPHRLTYTWRMEGISKTPERVTVRFEPQGEVTEVIVTHERIPNQTLRDQHQHGWQGCLDGLAGYLGAPIERPGEEAR
jgi:uncharacterized protein YndB with AHSA1/START domain